MRKKRILVIGGLGFIGLHVVKRLLQMKHEVLVFTRLDGKADLIRSVDFLRDAMVVDGDITDFASVKKAVSGRDVIINLAAVVNRKGGESEQFLDFDVICRGHLNLLEACRQANKNARIVWFGSRSQFGPVSKRIKISEDRVQNPTSLYGAHKETAENYCRFYGRVFGIKTVILRPSSVYGPPVAGDDNKNVVNIFVKRALRGQPLMFTARRGDYKDYLYVEDLADAVIAIVESRIGNGIFNIGSSNSMRLLEIIAVIRKFFKNMRVINKREVRTPGMQDERNTWMDITRIRKETRWKPKVHIEEGIKRTIAYYRGRGGA